MARDELRAAQVPLAHVPGLVSALAQGLGQGELVVRQVVEEGHLQELAALLAVDPVGDAHARRVLARQQRGARGRADRAGGVGVRKAHPLQGQAVEVGRLVEGRAVAGKVPPAQVVRQKEYDVGLHEKAPSLLSRLF